MSGALPLGYRPTATWVAVHRSAPYAQIARLVLKVSLNLGANLSLSLFGLDQGKHTIQGTPIAERRRLVKRFGVDPRQIRLPTNGSGPPDSQATPRALVTMLRGMWPAPRSRAPAKSGRRLAYALMVNDVGAIQDIETDVARVFEDEAEIANAIFEGVR